MAEWRFITPEDASEPYAELWGNATCDGTGTDTVVDFGTEGLPDMADAEYEVLLTPYAASMDLALDEGNRAVGSFQVLHASGNSDKFGYKVIGKVKVID